MHWQQTDSPSQQRRINEIKALVPACGDSCGARESAQSVGNRQQRLVHVHSRATTALNAVNKIQDPHLHVKEVLPLMQSLLQARLIQLEVRMTGMPDGASTACASFEGHQAQIC